MDNYLDLHKYKEYPRKYWHLLKMIDKITESMVLCDKLIKPEDHQGLAYFYEKLYNELLKDYENDLYRNKRRQVPNKDLGRRFG